MSSWIPFEVIVWIRNETKADPKQWSPSLGSPFFLGGCNNSYHPKLLHLRAIRSASNSSSSLTCNNTSHIFIIISDIYICYLILCVSDPILARHFEPFTHPQPIWLLKKHCILDSYKASFLLLYIIQDRKHIYTRDSETWDKFKAQDFNKN